MFNAPGPTDGFRCPHGHGPLAVDALWPTAPGVLIRVRHCLTCGHCKRTREKPEGSQKNPEPAAVAARCVGFRCRHHTGVGLKVETTNPVSPGLIVRYRVCRACRASVRTGERELPASSPAASMAVSEATCPA